MDFALARRNLWKRFISKLILKSSYLIIVNSHALEREVQGFVSKKRIEVIYPSLSEELLALAENSAFFTKDSSEAINILTVARLVPRKGHNQSLDAFALLRDQGLRVPIRYYILGDGPLYRDLMEQVKSLHLQDWVIFIRHADDSQLIEYYQRADIFLMPTERLRHDIEGFGTVYIEAAAFGVPSIASDVPGVDEAVIHEQTGLLTAANSVTDLSVALDRLIHDHALREKLGKQAQIRAFSEFQASQQISKLEPFL